MASDDHRQSVFTTESLDMAAFLMAKGLVLENTKIIKAGRHQFILSDPHGQGKKLSLAFVNSDVARVLETRIRLIDALKSHERLAGLERK